MFAGQPRSTAALACALDPTSLATPVGPEGTATMESLADGLDEVRTQQMRGWGGGGGGCRTEMLLKTQFIQHNSGRRE